MEKFVVGIRNKESSCVSGLSVVEDPRTWMLTVKSEIVARPCAYSMFPDKFEFVVAVCPSDWSSVIEFGEVKKDEGKVA